MARRHRRARSSARRVRLVVIEGAGSPAEINLERYDIVNMRVARYAEAPVLHRRRHRSRRCIRVALWHRRAASRKSDRALIRGFVINKFRGDPSLLDPGFDMLLERTGVPTLGVLPYLDLSRLPAEDAVEWDSLGRKANEQTLIDVAVMRLPRVANLDEFQPLACEPGVSMRFVADPNELGDPDLIIIPGTKSTVADLAWLRERGLADAILAKRAKGTPGARNLRRLPDARHACDRREAASRRAPTSTRSACCR